MGKYYNKFYRNFKKWDKDILVSNCCGSETDTDICPTCKEGTTLVTEKEFERVDYDWKKHIWKIN
tara:strand:+ start:2115 stop:2309 length:195 start_codon:yes stop_codon:yes gene_type:complete